MASVSLAKKALRKEVKESLKILTEKEKVHQSKIVTHKIFNLPEYKQSSRMSIFLNMDDEIRTAEILEDALVSGKSCYIPRYDSTSNFMDMVRVKSVAEINNLPVTKWNIKQPSLDDQRETASSSGGLDFILVPGMAFTSTGLRLGRGRGYYDTYLNKLLSKPLLRPSLVAVAFKEQIVTSIPVVETDVIMDKVIWAD